MSQFFIAKNIHTKKNLLIKFDEKVSVVPIWKSIPAAEGYLKTESWGHEFQPSQFSIVEFETAKKGHEDLGVSLFLHLMG